MKKDSQQPQREEAARSRRSWRERLLLSIVLVPLTNADPWLHLDYGRRVPKNKVRFDPNGMHIQVRASSSPLFYRLGRTRFVETVEVHGKVSGFPKQTKGKIQDDYALRFGLVIEGENRFSFFDRLLAPSWVRGLMSLEPKKGISRVSFLNLGHYRNVGERWRHAKLDFVDEEIVAKLDEPGHFAFQYHCHGPERVFALWVQADGDNTKSDFDVHIKKIKLNTLAPTKRWITSPDS